MYIKEAVRVVVPNTVWRVLQKGHQEVKNVHQRVSRSSVARNEIRAECTIAVTGLG
jgi:hypothetical protein